MDLRGLQLDSSLVFEPKRIVVIVGPNRAGTTVFKHALCLHPDLCHLAGEHEPYMKLSCNGYPWHLSDEFHVPNDPDVFRLLVANEMHNHRSVVNRRWLQLERIEAPPYVEAIECRRTDTFVVKVPHDCFRRGVWEVLYPTAEIVYVCMSRSPHAVVNGLLDGWESGSFTARVTPLGWWCFCMPPGWSWHTSLLDRCIDQYKQSALHTAAIALDAPGAIRVSFEEFIADWRDQIRAVWRSLGLAPFDPPDAALPTLMATDKPSPDRWKTKRPWLEEVQL